MNYSPNLLKILGTEMAARVIRTTQAEHKLFQAIIMQAFEDCTSFTYSKIDAYNKQDSVNWFVQQSDEFKEICLEKNLKEGSNSSPGQFVIEKAFVD